MGLDIGVVKIQYLDRPSDSVYDFLQYLTAEAVEAEWNVSGEGNSFVELYYSTMVAKVAEFIKERNLHARDTDSLLGWIRNLPWDGNTIMLHLSW